MTAVAERRRPTSRDRRLWLCGCGYVNGDGTACQACEAPAPPSTSDEVAASYTPLRILWEQVQAERWAAANVRPAARFGHTPAWPAPACPAPSTARPTRTQRVGITIAAVVCLTALFTATLAFVGVRRSEQSWPTQWDPRVAAIAAFDEAHRGLQFEHPVPVVFLSDAAFRQKVAGGGGDSNAADASEAQRVVAELRALGLANGTPDLAGGSRDVAAEDIEGFYDDHAKTVWVRGDTVTPHLAVILAHELTHALQDQTFGLRIPADEDAATAYRALVEADAVRIQDMYLASLSPADQRSFQQAEDAVGGKVDHVAGEVPPVLIDSEQFPYQVGPHFVDVLLSEQGQAGLDNAFRHPPTSTLQIIEPSRYLNGSSARWVDPPTARGHEREVDPPSTGGAFQLLEILADRLDLGQAWHAASTWAGDSSIGYTAAGHVCVRMDVATIGDPGELEGALRAWSAAAGRGLVSRGGQSVRLDVCDPGPNAGALRSRGFSPLDALDIRGFMAKGLASEKLSAPTVDCAADVLLQSAGDPGMQRLVDAAGTDDPANLFQTARSIGEQARDAVRAQCLDASSSA